MRVLLTGIAHGIEADAERLNRLGLRANTVSPAAVETRIPGDFMEAFGERASRGVALTGRPGRPGEVAEAVAWLARPESGWVRGTNMVVDGGRDVMNERPQPGRACARPVVGGG